MRGCYTHLEELAMCLHVYIITQIHRVQNITVQLFSDKVEAETVMFMRRLVIDQPNTWY